MTINDLKTAIDNFVPTQDYLHRNVDQVANAAFVNGLVSKGVSADDVKAAHALLAEAQAGVSDAEARLRKDVSSYTEYYAIVDAKKYYEFERNLLSDTIIPALCDRAPKGTCDAK